ncbi:hypothetical protein ZOSMA_95G00690 [Zostera marina]|uniref:ABC transmembrane type-1 domain-containing protein n=1 Tax=Zostera marina TaxID=29655 RepID=A0A0K9NIM0_ZOSMR|nr:hypothetical protein ZOSMA_95G00690 [Zostera marina]
MRSIGWFDDMRNASSILSSRLETDARLLRTIAVDRSTILIQNDKIIGLYSRELEKPSRRSFRRGEISGIFYGVTQFFLFSSYGLTLWYRSVFMGRGEASFRSVMKYFMALAMGETLALAPDIVKENQTASSVFEVLDRNTTVASDVGEDVPKVDGFHYPSRPDIIIFEDFNLKVKARKSMVLVGSSGSGKSTVISLLLRFYDPTSGKILIDGMSWFIFINR